MTPEEIRAAAIERLARSEYDAWKEAYDRLDDGPPAPTFDEAGDGYSMKRGYRRIAARQVDALGDLLPTAEEISTCFPDEPAADDEPMRRYVTAWREVTN